MPILIGIPFCLFEFSSALPKCSYLMRVFLIMTITIFNKNKEFIVSGKVTSL